MSDFMDSSFGKRSLRYKIALIITIFGLISLVSGGSYAILKGDVASENEQVIRVGNVKILLTEDFSSINDTVYILSDKNGLLLDNTYNFSVKNIGDASAKIDVKLLNDAPSNFSGTLLNDEYIKVGLEVNGKEMGPMSLSDVENVIDSNIINKNEIINYKMRLWLDESNKADILNLNDPKTFLKIKVDAEQRVRDKKNDATVSSVNFSTDSWSTIVTAVRNGDTSAYHVGDTKSINLGSLGTHTLRIANMSTPSECNSDTATQSACGFVLEFADIVSYGAMDEDGLGTGGWPASLVRSFVNNNVYSLLPDELQECIVDTRVVSTAPTGNSVNSYTSLDKLYLLSVGEVYGASGNQTDYLRQLDYYASNGCTITSNFSVALKTGTHRDNDWFLRTGMDAGGDTYAAVSGSAGGRLHAFCSDDDTIGISPAFRIG